MYFNETSVHLGCYNEITHHRLATVLETGAQDQGPTRSMFGEGLFSGSGITIFLFCLHMVKG